ncbi:hypothetical protein LLE81_00055 [Staphylococcus epidermidis]|nr:hypothetical protein [Staphylococcus epidermidis]
MSNKPLKAYQVGEGMDGGHVITFATNSATARREGGNELSLQFNEVSFCRRAPWADHYAGQPFIPAKAYHEEGWWLSCRHCSAMRYSDCEDDDGNKLEFVYDGPSMFCNRECQEALEKDIAAANQRGDDFIHKVHAMRPDLRFTSFRCGYPYVTMTAEFTFPGCRYGGSIVDQEGDGSIATFICGADVEDWQAYERSRLRAGFERRV